MELNILECSRYSYIIITRLRKTKGRVVVVVALAVYGFVRSTIEPKLRNRF